MKCDVINDVKLFPTVFCSFLRYPIRRLITKASESELMLYVPVNYFQPCGGVSAVELVSSNEDEVSCSRTQYYANRGTQTYDQLSMSLAYLWYTWKNILKKVNNLIKSAEDGKKQAIFPSMHSIIS